MLLSQCEGYCDLGRRPMKGMLAGPVTVLQWSFVRDDQPHRDTCLQIALADSATQTPSGLASTIFTRYVCQPNRRWPILFSVREKSFSLSTSGWIRMRTQDARMARSGNDTGQYGWDRKIGSTLCWEYDIMRDSCLIRPAIRPVGKIKHAASWKTAGPGALSRLSHQRYQK